MGNGIFHEPNIDEYFIRMQSLVKTRITKRGIFKKRYIKETYIITPQFFPNTWKWEWRNDGEIDLDKELEECKSELQTNADMIKFDTQYKGIADDFLIREKIELENWLKILEETITERDLRSKK
jgi:hypothetical protein